MLNLIIAAVLSQSPVAGDVYEAFRNPNLGQLLCAEQGPNGWKLDGDFNSNYTDWEANREIGELIGDGNCQFGWTITETVDPRISYEMPLKVCPPVYHWTFTSPFGVVVEGATDPLSPCKVIKRPVQKLGKPLTSKGKSGASTGASTSDPDDNSSGGGDDNSDDNGNNGNGGNGNNGNGGNGGSCNNGIGNGGDGCSPGNSGNGANGGQDD